MSERSEPRVVPLRLVLDFDEVVELDGSTLFDSTAESVVPAVVFRMPPHRADFIGKALAAYTSVCRLAGEELPAVERGPAWALMVAAEAAGFVDSLSITPSRVTSARRMAAGAVLRRTGSFDDLTMIAVVDAAARWLEEPDGGAYALALLGAVTEAPTQREAYRELLGTGSAGDAS